MVVMGDGLKNAANVIKCNAEAIQYWSCFLGTSLGHQQQLPDNISIKIVCMHYYIEQ